MKFPQNLQYSESHEWVEKIGPESVRVGLSDYAQSHLSNLVFVNLPEVGDAVTLGESFADVESVKTVSEVYSPVSGVVTAVNEALLDAPGLINDNPYEAWLVEIGDITETGDLLDADAYEACCKAGSEED